MPAIPPHVMSQPAWIRTASSLWERSNRCNLKLERALNNCAAAGTSCHSAGVSHLERSQQQRLSKFDPSNCFYEFLTCPPPSAVGLPTSPQNFCVNHQLPSGTVDDRGALRAPQQQPG